MWNSFVDKEEINIGWRNALTSTPGWMIPYHSIYVVIQKHSLQHQLIQDHLWSVNKELNQGRKGTESGRLVYRNVMPNVLRGSSGGSSHTQTCQVQLSSRFPSLQRWSAPGFSESEVCTDWADRVSVGVLISICGSSQKLLSCNWSGLVFF